jgi:adenylate cyclase
MGLWDAVRGRLIDPGSTGAGLRAVVERFVELVRRGSGLDLAEEGLLDGLTPEEQDARAELLEQLHAAGVPLEELRRAVEEDRLALLPVEQVLAGEDVHTLAEMAASSGLDEASLMSYLAALGLHASPDSTYNDNALAAATALRQLRDAGLEEAGIVDVGRVMGQSLVGVAEAMRSLVAESLLYAGDSERDLGLRYAAAARQLVPVLGPLLEFTVTMHLLELVRGDMVGNAERASGQLPGARRITAGFADLSGFTLLGERASAEEMAAIVRRFESLTASSTSSAVRHVKTVGDAVMLVADEPGPIVAALLELVGRAEVETDGFPRVHAGAASGRALRRGGDWYGQPVNLASRICTLASPGTLLGTQDVCDATSDAHAWSATGPRRQKGLDEKIPLFRLDGPGEED